MAGVREGGGPPQPLHPKEHVSTWGGSPSVSESQLDSGSDPGLWSILGPTVCAICFSEVHKPTKATAQSETFPQNQKLKTGSFRVTF